MKIDVLMLGGFIALLAIFLFSALRTGKAVYGTAGFFDLLSVDRYEQPVAYWLVVLFMTVVLGGSVWMWFDRLAGS